MIERRARQDAISPRGGFTLVELMTVVAILAVLMALIASAAFQVVAVQQQRNTETTIKKVGDALDQQIQQVIEQAKTEMPPNDVLSMAGSDARRAKIIWRKARLKQEFPMTFADALAPNIPSLSQTDLPPRQSYVDTFNGWGWTRDTITAASTIAAASNSAPIVIRCGGAHNLTSGTRVMVFGALGNSAANSEYIVTVIDATQFSLDGSMGNGSYTGGGSWFAADEPGACLYLALKQNRRGISFDLDSSLSSAEVGTVTIRGKPVTAILDAWGHALSYYRWPAGNSELNLSTATPFRDFQDPEGTLADSNWTNSTGRQNFTNLCHPLPPVASVNNSFFLPPVVVSFGPGLGVKKKTSGLKDPFMTPITSGPGAGNDNGNIYSYRLRLGGRGD
jgi:prepilin-type N-terminal cleavage/methylation domain-containing protein